MAPPKKPSIGSKIVRSAKTTFRNLTKRRTLERKGIDGKTTTRRHSHQISAERRANQVSAELNTLRVGNGALEKYEVRTTNKDVVDYVNRLLKTRFTENHRFSPSELASIGNQIMTQSFLQKHGRKSSITLSELVKHINQELGTNFSPSKELTALDWHTIGRRALINGVASKPTYRLESSRVSLINKSLRANYAADHKFTVEELANTGYFLLRNSYEKARYSNTPKEYARYIPREFDVSMVNRLLGTNYHLEYNFSQREYANIAIALTNPGIHSKLGL